MARQVMYTIQLTGDQLDILWESLIDDVQLMRDIYRKERWMEKEIYKADARYFRLAEQIEDEFQRAADTQ